MHIPWPGFHPWKLRERSVLYLLIHVEEHIQRILKVETKQNSYPKDVRDSSPNEALEEKTHMKMTHLSLTVMTVGLTPRVYGGHHDHCHRSSVHLNFSSLNDSPS